MIQKEGWEVSIVVGYSDMAVENKANGMDEEEEDTEFVFPSLEMQ